MEFDLLNDSLSRGEFSMMRGCQSNWECFQFDGYLEDLVQVDRSCFGKNLELDRSSNFYLNEKIMILEELKQDGIEPKRLLSERSRNVRSTSLHNSIGIGPSK